MVFGLVIHFLAMRGDLNRISVLAYIVTLYGFSWYAFGKSVGLKMMFPFAFLLFMLPIFILILPLRVSPESLLLLLNACEMPRWMLGTSW